MKSGALRTAAKRTAERAVAASGLCAVARQHYRGDVLVLAYHNILPTGVDPAGDTSLHLPQADFASQLDALSRTHRIVGLRDILSTLPSPPAALTRPRAVITFDDAYTGALTAGVAELRKRNLPATVFVAPDFLGERCFWWDLLASGPEGLEKHVRDTGLTSARGRHADVMQWARDRNIPLTEPPSHLRCATEAQLHAALEHTGLTVGSHTWSHPNLTRLSAAELNEELTRSRDWLKRLGERALPVISYPYGIADSRVWHASQQAGYTAGLMVSGGWFRPSVHDRLSIPRMNIPAGVSRDGFVLRAAGLLKQH